MGTTFDIDDFSMNDYVGIIPRAVVDIFEQIEAIAFSEFAIEAQFIEVILPYLVYTSLALQRRAKRFTHPKEGKSCFILFMRPF